MGGGHGCGWLWFGGVVLTREGWGLRFRSAEVTGSYCKSSWLLRSPHSSLGGVGGDVYDERMRQCASFTDDVAFLRPQNLWPIISAIAPRSGSGPLSLLPARLTTLAPHASNLEGSNLNSKNTRNQSRCFTCSSPRRHLRRSEGRRAGCYFQPKTSVDYRHVIAPMTSHGRHDSVFPLWTRRPRMQ